MKVISDINIFQVSVRYKKKLFFSYDWNEYKTCSRKHINHTWHVLCCLV